MPIDLSNNSTTDPNGVKTIADARVTAYLPSGENDWSRFVIDDPTAAQQQGLTRKVDVSLATLNSGDQYWVVRDAKGAPILNQPLGDRVSIDSKQHDAFMQIAPKPIAPGGSPTQRRQAPDGQMHIYAYNPATGFYDDDQGAVASGTKPPIPLGGSSGTEGTPDPSKPDGWDNTRPRQVIKDAKGNPIWSEELTGSDLTAWRANQQATQPATDEEDVKDHPGWVQITTKTGNNTTRKYRGPDGQVVDTLPPAQGAVTSVATQINGHTYYTVTKAVPATATSPATTTPTFEDENHNPIASLPVQAKPGEIVKGGGKNGEDVQAVADPAHPGQLQYVAIPGAIPAGRRQLPAGMPVLDTSSPDAAQQSYLAQVAWVQQQRTTGGLSTQEAQDLLTPSYTAAKAVMDKAQQDITNSSTLRGQDLTERGQNLGEVQSRRAAADTGFDSMFTATNGQAAHLGRGNGGLAAAAFRDALALRQGYAAQAGGYADVPATQLSPALASVRTTTVHPDGTVQVQHPVADGPYAPHGAAVGPVAAGVTATTAAAANPTGQNVQAANDATMTGSQAAFGAAGVPAAAPVFAPPPPVTGSVGAVPPYLQAARGQAPQWSHDAVVADLRAQGMPEDHIQQALDEYYAEQGAGAAA